MKLIDSMRRGTESAVAMSHLKRHIHSGNPWDQTHAHNVPGIGCTYVIPLGDGKIVESWTDCKDRTVGIFSTLKKAGMAKRPEILGRWLDPNS